MYHTLVSVNELREQLDKPDWVIVDCRFDLSQPDQGRRDYLVAHVPGAVFADLDTDLSSSGKNGGGRHPLPEPDALRRLFSRLGIDNRCQVVAYDDNGGGFAARFWWMLRHMGHDRVAVLDGGWSAWLAAEAPTRDGDEQRRPREFEGSPRPDETIDVGMVIHVPLLIDSRDPARYRGEFEPLDPAAGHIPGAYNRFWKMNLDDADRFKSPARLSAELQQLYGNADPDAVTFYCGSGVTACHNILAAVHAGLPQPRLYPGSWSEWCADSARPIATGDEP